MVKRQPLVSRHKKEEKKKREKMKEREGERKGEREGGRDRILRSNENSKRGGKRERKKKGERITRSYKIKEKKSFILAVLFYSSSFVLF